MAMLGPHSFRILRTALFGIVIGLSARSCDRKPPEIPALSKRSEYEKIFADIDRAEAENDPIKRCLIYPSPPHLNWSPALIEALCRDKFTGGSFAAELKPMIDAREWKKLDAHFAGFLERHYSGEDPEYRLYRAFPLISWKNGSDADRYTLRWVKGAPDSPYANTGRAKILMSQAWELRGGGFIKDVPPERTRRAIGLARQASVLLNRAIKQEPKLLPAYDIMMEAYVLGGQPQMMRRALRAALRQSPTSYYVRSTAATYMSQFWGGTLEEMDALVKEARPQFARNPRLAMLTPYRVIEEGRLFDVQERYRRALPSLREALEAGPSFEALARAERSASKLGYDVEGLVYLSQNIRFERAPRDELLLRARLWEWDSDYPRALRDLRAAAKLYPTDQSIAKKLMEAEKRAQTAPRRRTDPS
jgi:tetratricopeptide (TPR) repeat protein